MTDCICRVPAKSDVLRNAQWIGAITKHQKYDSSRTVFNVCIRHFDTSNLYLRGQQYVLKLNAIPTLFNKTNNAAEVKFGQFGNGTKAINDNDVDNNQDDCEEKCEFLTTKIAELEKQIDSMKIQHDIEIQKLKIKSVTVREKEKIRLKTIKNELSKQKTQVLRLNDIIKELHEQHYISPDDAKFLNVSSKYRSSKVLILSHFFL